MTALTEALRLPDYFGRNWDALTDCLRDLSWLPPGRITLIHDSLPALSQVELHTYVHVLADAMEDWKPGERCVLVVIFPEGARHRVLEALAGRPGNSTHFV